MEQSTRVLIVDDEENIRQSLQHLLEDTGFMCRTASDSVEGLTALRDEDFDVVLADLAMPGKDGIGLLRDMREVGVEAVPVIMTGCGEVSNAVEAMKLGAFDFLCKPVKLPMLVGVVRKAAAYRRAVRHSRAMERIAAEWQTTFDACPDMIVVLDTECRVVRCNRAYIEQLGVSEAEVVGATCCGIICGTNGTSDGCICAQTLQDGRGRTREIRSDRLNGDLVVSTAPLRNGSEHPFGAVFVLRDVTESKQAAEALRQREEMLNGFFEWAPDAILVVDGAGRITRVNKQIEVIFGYSREELIGKPVEDLMPERFRQHHLQHRAAYLDKPYIRFMSDSINLLGQRKDGSEFPTDITLSLLKTAGENFIVTFIRDTTERRRAERRLAAQHAVTRILAESPTLNEATPRILQAICESLEWDEGAIWVVDDAANVLRCVEVWHAPRAQIEAFVAMSRQITFAPGVGLPGRVWASSQPAWIEDVTRDANFPRAPIAAQVGLHGAFAFPILSGGEVMSVIEFFSHKIQQPDDDLLKMMSTIGSQIGQFMERKRASESLRQAHREINHLLGAISSILISVGQDYRITRWSTVAEQTFGMASADAVGRAIDQCGIQWDASIVIEGLRECQTENEPVRLRDIRYTRPDGKEGLLGITLNPIRDDAGTPIGFLLLGVDVTERRFLEAQLTQTQKLESIGRLAAGIAHEINTPTQYVGDNTRFLQDAFGDLRQLMEKYGNLLTASKNGGVSPELINEVESAAQEADVEYLLEEIPQAISQSLEGVDRVAHIVRAMKEFSHPGVEEKTSVDLNKAIESTITVARNEWKYVADMVTELDASLPLVPCLPGDINQVFLNIIVNAAHAIADVVGDGSEDKGTIAIATRRDGDWVEVRISDTGKGIPESVRSRIFDPFFTTKEVGKGTGQGLAIARSVVVDKHGGTITFETEAGKGTTFIVRLPLADCS